MAIEKVLDAENSPDIKNQSSTVEVFPEETRQDKIANAAQILVNEEEILLDDEMMEPEAPQMDFNANLVEFIVPIAPLSNSTIEIKESLASKTYSSIFSPLSLKVLSRQLIFFILPTG